MPTMHQSGPNGGSFLNLIIKEKINGTPFIFITKSSISNLIYSLHLLNHVDIPVFSLSEQEKRMSTVLMIAFGLRYRKQSDEDHNADGYYGYAPTACLEADGDDDDDDDDDNGGNDCAPAASLEGSDDDDGNYDYAPAA